MIGRNDPCPCGSGIKYKKCCSGMQDTGGKPTGPATGAVLDELKEMLKGQSIASLEEANAFAAQYMQQRNQAPIDDFHGLTSEQMHWFLNFPFETPQLAEFPSRLDITPEAPVVTLFTLLAEAIGEQGMKPTATGNLPRNFCRESALAYFGKEEYQSRTRLGDIQREPEFGEMHVTRLVAELAGLIRKYKGKFILSKECRTILAKEGTSGIYPRLFRAFAREYNWGYQDRYQDVPFIQQSFLFSLYLLSRYGSDWQSNTFYADSFLRAFPALLSQVPPMGSYLSPEQVLRGSYSLRCLERFASFMGLAETNRAGNDRYSDGFKVRKLPLLDHVVHFHL